MRNPGGSTTADGSFRMNVRKGHRSEMEDAVRPRVLLADDHTIVLEGLVRLISEDFEVAGTVSDGAALRQAVLEQSPDVVVTDISMPKESGLQVVRDLCARGVKTRFVMLTMHDDPQLAREAFSAGARGYLLKNAAGDELVRAIHEVVAGRTYLSSLIAAETIGLPMEEDVDGAARSQASRNRLTQRQLQVLRLVAEGHSMKGIARELEISRRTVESHKYEIMRKVGAKNTAELVLRAVRLGIVPVTSDPDRSDQT